MKKDKGGSAKAGKITAFGQTPISRTAGRGSAPPKPAQRAGLNLKNPKKGAK